MDAPFRSSIPVEDLFWQKVNKSAGCWEWSAGKSREGYGDFWLNGTMVRAHRVSYEWANGPIPVGLQIDHMCLNEGCVNPDHLRLATNALNGQNRRGASSNSTSGIRGVSWNKRSRRWQAYATLNGIRADLGMHTDKSDAELAVTAWRAKNMPYSLMDRKKVS